MTDAVERQQAQILQCFKQVDDIFHAYAVGQELSDSAFWILYALCEAEKPCTQNELCEAWYYTKQTVHSAVAGLARAGHVRLEHVPGSRNSKYIALTEAGSAYVDAHIRPVIEAEKSAFGRMSDGERRRYLALARKHVSLLDEAIAAIPKRARPDAPPR